VVSSSGSYQFETRGELDLDMLHFEVSEQDCCPCHLCSKRGGEALARAAEPVGTDQHSKPVRPAIPASVQMPVRLVPRVAL
jgi:hypothetical protein